MYLSILNIHIRNTHTYEQLFRQYPALFEGIGKLKGVEVKLHIDPDLLWHKKLNEFLYIYAKVVKLLEQQNIIERVDGPTPWVSPLVLILKKNTIC